MAERGEEQARTYEETDNNSKRKLDEIQLAKQKAQEIVARLVNSAESKRPRIEDSSEPPSGSFPNVPSFPDVSQKPATQLTTNSQFGSVPYGAPTGSYYGSQGMNKRIGIPNGKVGVIIGKGGETIKYLQLHSGAKIQITKDTDADLYSQTRDVSLTGTPEQVSRAEQLINDVIAETDAGGSAPTGGHGSGEQFTMKVPNDKVALMIGKGGETIKNMQSRSGARIQIIPLHLPPGDTSTERTVYINGSKEQIESAKVLVNDVLSGNRAPRNPGGYTQQAYHPPTGNWSQPSMQQPGYGYTQPGAYAAPPPYYSNYPPQVAAGWDQSNPSTAPLAPQQSTGYNYYGQQEPGAQADASYAYGQAPQAASQSNDQGYSQQPQSYGQDAQSQVPQYDQQKAYTTPGYGLPPVASSQLDCTVTSQAYGTQPSTQPPPSYPVTYSQPPTAAPVYSQPPTVPAYSQPPTVPPAYSQPPAAPAADYGSSQSYGAPVAGTQAGYDQTGYPQSGYGGGPQQPQLPSSATPPVYGQGSYPSQPPPAQSSYNQGD